MHGRNPFLAVRADHILHAVGAQNLRPVGFRIGVVLLPDLLEKLYCLIIFITAPQIISLYEILGILAVLWQGLRQTAVQTFPHSGLRVRDLQCPAAHFTRKYSHVPLSFPYALHQSVSFKSGSGSRLSFSQNLLQKSGLLCTRNSGSSGVCPAR